MLIASRDVVTTLAERFVARNVRATWATVGPALRLDLGRGASAHPVTSPQLRRPELDPYAETFGPDEHGDPLHLAGSLVDRLCELNGQEIASHTFSHFYCLERGPDAAAFAADLAAAQSRGGPPRLATQVAGAAAQPVARRLCRSRARCRIRMHPRPATRLGQSIATRRGHQPAGAGRPFGHDLCRTRAAHLRLGRAHDPSGLCDVPASTFLRPFRPATRSLEKLQYHRLVAGLRDAARRGRVLHVWWHPQNFVTDPPANYTLLERLLDEFDRLRVSDGLQSLSMGDVNDAVTGRALRRLNRPGRTSGG